MKNSEHIQKILASLYPKKSEKSERRIVVWINIPKAVKLFRRIFHV